MYITDIDALVSIVQQAATNRLCACTRMRGPQYRFLAYLKILSKCGNDCFRIFEFVIHLVDAAAVKRA